MFQKSLLENGVRILTASLPHTHSVSLAFLVGAGSRYETAERAGSFHFIEHVAFKGTRKRPTAREVSEAIEGVGGFLNASTDREMTSYWCKVARPHFSVAMDVLVDMLLEPLFVPQEVDKERQVILEELASSNDHPDYRVDLLIDELLWPDQPMGRDVGGTPESVQGLSRPMLLEYRQRQYTPQSTVISVAGDITHEEVVMPIRQALSRLPQGEPMPYFPARNGQKGPRIKLEQRKTDQAHLSLAVPGVSGYHPDRYALDLLSVVLGEGMSSRLFLELRERRGLVYDVHSYASHYLDCGSFIVSLGTDPKKARSALQFVLQELEQIKNGIPEGELEKAKELTKGRLFLRMEDTRSVAFWTGVQELLMGQVLTVDEVVARVEAVAPADVRRMANEFLLTERLNLAIVGNYRSEGPFARLLKL